MLSTAWNCTSVVPWAVTATEPPETGLDQVVPPLVDVSYRYPESNDPPLSLERPRTPSATSGPPSRRGSGHHRVGRRGGVDPHRPGDPTPDQLPMLSTARNRTSVSPSLETCRLVPIWVTDQVTPLSVDVWYR